MICSRSLSATAEGSDWRGMPEYGALSKSIFDGKCSPFSRMKYIPHYIRKSFVSRQKRMKPCVFLRLQYGSPGKI
jgi:hypothetical protein